MSIVYSSDLSKANSSSLMNAIEDIISSSNKMSNQIENFISESKDELKGGGYDAVRTKLSIYADAFKKQANICSNLYGNVKSANNAMLNYMEGYSKLNDSEKEEIRKELKNARNMLEWLEEYSDIWVLDKETQEKTKKKRRNGSDYQIESYRKIIVELEKLLEKLEHLKEEDHGAYSMISSVVGDINSYSTCIEGISTSTFSV